jgi:hypothetical protein
MCGNRYMSVGRRKNCDTYWNASKERNEEKCRWKKEYRIGFHYRNTEDSANWHKIEAHISKSKEKCQQALTVTATVYGVVSQNAPHALQPLVIY